MRSRAIDTGTFEELLESGAIFRRQRLDDWGARGVGDVVEDFGADLHLRELDEEVTKSDAFARAGGDLDHLGVGLWALEPHTLDPALKHLMLLARAAAATTDDGTFVREPPRAQAGPAGGSR